MKRLMKTSLGLLAASLFSMSAMAQINYFEDFESLDPGDAGALGNTGWSVFGIVWTDYPGCSAYAYDYGGVFPAPNDGGGFSTVVTADVGDDGQAINIFNDYNNGNHRDGSNNCIESSVFQERTLGPGDVGSYEFRFDTQVPGPLGPNVNAFGFIKLLDPNNGFNLDLILTVDTTLPGPKVISVDFDDTANGKIVQWGWTTQAGNDEASGRFYDNVYFGAPLVAPEPGTFTNIPTLDHWGLLIMALLLGGLGLFTVTRR